MVVLWGQDGIMIYNDAYAKFAGDKHPELLGSKVTEGWPEVAEFNSDVLKKVLTGETVSLKNKKLSLRRGKNPEDIWMNLHYSPILDESGQPQGLLGVVVETTKQVIALRQIKSSEKQLSSVLDSMGDGFFMLDKKFCLLKANYMYEVLTGISRSESIGKNIWEVFPSVANESSKYWTEYHKVMKTRQSAHFIEKFESQNIWTEVDAHPVEGGGISVFFRDVSKKLQATAKLKESEDRFRIVAENATTGIFMMDSNQRCTYMNPAAEIISGYSFDQISNLDQPLHDIIHNKRQNGKPYALIDCPIDRSFPERSRMSGEDYFVRPNGKLYPVSFMASPIIKNNEPIGTIIEVRDISEQKKSERELRELITITEQRNALIKINKAKDEFIGLASHQLRTPATASNNT